MMTPAELREYEFKGAGRNAYKSDDVDEFFATVAIAYEKMYRENAELVKRVGLLADRLEQYKNDESEIKQAVLSAQKAADIIVKEAEISVEDSKSEADAILAAAKGEADIIKADAEKQAIADSDLLLSIARDKAEAIINKAKEEAHGILIKANDSASNTVGAANRTVTSESLHYDMLKKEVSEFRASILSQYKAHIEMISKLPELAIEKANEIEEQKKADEASLVVDVADEEAADDAMVEAFEIVTEDIPVTSFDEDEEDFTGEDVVKTTLPFDFFEENTSLEFVEESEEEADSADEQPFESGFSLGNADFDFSNDFADEIDETDDDSLASEMIEEILDDEASEEADVDEIDVEENIDDELETEESTEKEYEDIPISKGFAVNAGEIDFSMFEDDNDTPSMFDSFEKIDDNKFSAAFDDDDDEDDEDDDSASKSKFGFFRRKK